MYDPKSVSPMEDYRRRNAKSARIDSKRADLQARRDSLRVERRALIKARSAAEEVRWQEVSREMAGIAFDLEQLHREQLAIWQTR